MKMEDENLISQLQAEKLRIEINQLNEPFWRKSNVMVSVFTIILTAIIGFSSYFVSVDEANQRKITELEAKIEEDTKIQHEIELRTLGLEKTQMQQLADDNKKKYDESATRLVDIGTRINAKEKEITLKKQQIAGKEQTIAANKKKLEYLNSELESARIHYNRYIREVKEVVSYMKDYGPSYGHGIVDSPNTVAVLQQVAATEGTENRIAAIKKFTNHVLDQTFSRYSQLKEMKLDSIR